MAKRPPRNANRESRLNVRVDARLLADEEAISLSRKQIAHILETLDDPPAKSVTALRKLLTQRSILDS